MWASILGALTNQVGGFFKGKQELAKVKLEANKIVIKAEAETAMAVALSKAKMVELGQTQSFDLDRVNKSGARFDPDKTKWVNQHYLQTKSNEEIADLYIEKRQNI